MSCHVKVSLAEKFWLWQMAARNSPKNCRSLNWGMAADEREIPLRLLYRSLLLAPKLLFTKMDV
ncbi:hypothetical protein [Kamptonema sp. UHCC 0994]|uniref:hypothetical protein n=1 Tax=Kamptonema sp. UHCC 0994 TaxID=3031329 RepID=UPI0023B8884A|nr:hypothetical protein [Kamptonema sp. UHCC 0994]MDF0551657.1 hypothetical protein [Kamptonema sp. UHCC 0994]